MTTTQFIKISKTGKTPQFKQLIGLTESYKTSELMDFCTLMHPNTTKHAQGSVCNVYTENSHFIYRIYTTCILRTNASGGERKLYSLN